MNLGRAGAGGRGAGGAGGMPGMADLRAMLGPEFEGQVGVCMRMRVRVRTGGVGGRRGRLQRAQAVMALLSLVCARALLLSSSGTTPALGWATGGGGGHSRLLLLQAPARLAQHTCCALQDMAALAQQADQMWKMLDNMAENDPEGYKAFLASQVSGRWNARTRTLGCRCAHARARTRSRRRRW